MNALQLPIARCSLLVMAWLILWLSGFAAPAPAYRPTPHRIVGTWDMVWDRQLIRRAVFSADGEYRAGGTAGAATWAGTWSLDGDTLTIREGVPPLYDYVGVYRIDLDRHARPPRGRLYGRAYWALNPSKE